MKRSRLRPLLALTAACAALGPANAQVPRPASYFVQAGAGEEASWNATAGVVWPWGWRHGVMGAELGAITEAYVSHWDARSASGGRHGFTQVGVVPLVRLRFDRGRSPWFVEAGIGVSLMDRRFATRSKEFSTAFNFVDIVGAGRSFGTAGDQELGLRLQHVSNASIRRPNPGQNFVMLRYAAKF